MATTGEKLEMISSLLAEILHINGMINTDKVRGPELMMFALQYVEHIRQEKIKENVKEKK
jgi:hypothetical protein